MIKKLSLLFILCLSFLAVSFSTDVTLNSCGTYTLANNTQYLLNTSGTNFNTPCYTFNSLNHVMQNITINGQYKKNEGTNYIVINNNYGIRDLTIKNVYFIGSGTEFIRIWSARLINANEGFLNRFIFKDNYLVNNNYAGNEYGLVVSSTGNIFSSSIVANGTRIESNSFINLRYNFGLGLTVYNFNDYRTNTYTNTYVTNNLFYNPNANSYDTNFISSCYSTGYNGNYNIFTNYYETSNIYITPKPYYTSLSNTKLSGNLTGNNDVHIAGDSGFCDIFGLGGSTNVNFLDNVHSQFTTNAINNNNDNSNDNYEYLSANYRFKSNFVQTYGNMVFIANKPSLSTTIANSYNEKYFSYISPNSINYLNSLVLNDNSLGFYNGYSNNFANFTIQDDGTIICLKDCYYGNIIGSDLTRYLVSYSKSNYLINRTDSSTLASLIFGSNSLIDNLKIKFTPLNTYHKNRAIISSFPSTTSDLLQLTNSKIEGNYLSNYTNSENAYFVKFKTNTAFINNNNFTFGDSIIFGSNWQYNILDIETIDKDVLVYQNIFNVSSYAGSPNPYNVNIFGKNAHCDVKFYNNYLGQNVSLFDNSNTACATKLKNPSTQTEYYYNGNIYTFTLGNYYEGFSESCTDSDNNAICDLPYTANGMNDTHALKIYPYPFLSKLAKAELLIPANSFTINNIYPINNSNIIISNSLDNINFKVSHTINYLSYTPFCTLEFGSNNVYSQAMNKNTEYSINLNSWTNGNYSYRWRCLANTINFYSPIYKFSITINSSCTQTNTCNGETENNNLETVGVQTVQNPINTSSISQTTNNVIDMQSGIVGFLLQVAPWILIPFLVIVFLIVMALLIA